VEINTNRPKCTILINRIPLLKCTTPITNREVAIKPTLTKEATIIKLVLRWDICLLMTPILDNLDHSRDWEGIWLRALLFSILLLEITRIKERSELKNYFYS